MIDSPPNTDVRGDIDYFFELARMADLRCKDLGPKTVATNHLAVALEILATHGGKETAFKQLEGLRQALSRNARDGKRPTPPRRRKVRSRKLK